MSGLTRRELLAQASVYGGSLILLRWPHTTHAAQSSTQRVTLSAEEWRTLEAIAARILPSDDGTPGATEAGCTNFIDKALANEEQLLRPIYTAALQSFDTLAQSKHQQPFHALSGSQQDALLEQVQNGNVQGFDAAGQAPASAFEILRVHTILGFLADPKYGGNKDGVGWRHVNYPGPRHHKGGYTPAQLLGTAKIDGINDSKPTK